MAFPRNAFTDALGNLTTYGSVVSPTKPKKPKSTAIGGGTAATVPTAPSNTSNMWPNTKSTTQLTNKITAVANELSGSASGSTGGSATDTGSVTDSPADGGASTDTGDGSGIAGSTGSTFSFPGGDPYSSAGMTTLLQNPYAFAQAWLQSQGGNWNTPTMMGVLGQIPALADSLEVLMNGAGPMNPEQMTDEYALQKRLEIMQDQLTPGGGIDGYQLIQRILDTAANESYSPGSGDPAEIQSRLGAIVGGISESGASSGAQINTINDLIKVALVNSNPTYAGMMSNMLDYYGNAYLTNVAQVDLDTPAISYALWLRQNGLMF